MLRTWKDWVALLGIALLITGCLVAIPVYLFLHSIPWQAAWSD